MDVLRPNLRLLLKRAVEAEHAHAASAGVRVTWQKVGERRGAFRARLAAIRTALPTNTLLLAACAYRCDHTLPGVTCAPMPKKHFAALHPSRRARYRNLYGGRGSAKSRSIALALILYALEKPRRILCTREFMKSIAESSHRLLSDQIEGLGLARFFDVKLTSITAANGSEFIFEGLHANVQKIKSLERIDIGWVEEAALVTAHSWDTLVPTIREPGSQIIVSFNPEDETNPTFQRFVLHPPPDAIVVKVDWRDNPFFPAELDAERRYLESVDPDAAAHIWGGACRHRSAAQVFAGKYVVEQFQPDIGWSGPYHGADWGFSTDPTVLVRCWIAGRVLYVDREAWGLGVDIDKLPALFDEIPDAREHLVRADSARPETISYLCSHGYPNIVPAAKWPQSPEDGVAYLRQFERIVVHPRCTHTIDEMRLYSYKTDRLSGDVLPDLVDKHNHCVDSLRYALEPMIRAGGGQGLIAFYEAELAKEAATAEPARGYPLAEKILGQGYPAAGDVVRPPDPSGARIAANPAALADLTSWHQEDGKWSH